jgi:xanthine/uracil/vitamin C permease (AzgA family)
MAFGEPCTGLRSALCFLASPNALTLYVGLALALLFDRLKVIGGVLLSILITSALYH